MVTDTRTQKGAGALRPLNTPRPVQVEDGEEGTPLRVKARGRWTTVTEVVDRWRIDDEWWRQRSLSRMYYQVMVTSGGKLTLFRDLLTGSWYEQRYG